MCSRIAQAPESLEPLPHAEEFFGRPWPELLSPLVVEGRGLLCARSPSESFNRGLRRSGGSRIFWRDKQLEQRRSPLGRVKQDGLQVAVGGTGLHHSCEKQRRASGNPFWGTLQMMEEPRERTVGLGWVLIVVLLMLGIDALLTRLLESLWVSLRERGSPAYLPLEWWMSLPFTVFVFVVLAALLTSFSGARSWLKTFVLLCTFKVIFTVATALSFRFRPYPDVMMALSQAGFLSLPSVLVHIFLSGIVVMLLSKVEWSISAAMPDRSTFLRSSGGLVKPLSGKLIALTSPEGERLMSQAERAARLAVGQGIAIGSAGVSPALPRLPLDEHAGGDACATEAAAAEGEYVSIPVGGILKAFPESVLAMSASEIEEISPYVPIPLEDVLPQLPEGRIEVEALAVILGIPPEAFAEAPQEVARKFPEGRMELPLQAVYEALKKIVAQASPPASSCAGKAADAGETPALQIATFEPPAQEFQPEVDVEFPDLFRELAPLSAQPVVEKPPIHVKRPPEAKPAPARPVLEPSPQVAETAAVVPEEERLLFERSRNVIEIAVESVLSQLPRGAFAPEGSDRSSRLPDTVVVPVELIVPQLAGGEVKLKVGHVLTQFPEGCLSLSELDIVRSLPKGEIELPLREIVPQLEPEVLAPPEQTEQLALEDMPDPFLEAAKLSGPSPHECGTAQLFSGRAEGLSRLVFRKGDSLDKPPAAPLRKERPSGPSFADMLREPDPLGVSVSTLVGLLPPGALRAPIVEVKRFLARETLRIPRSMVRGQLNEGRVVIPVEILTFQLAPEHLAMSVEQIKARFAGGLIELPLAEVIGQVMEEIAKPLEGQEFQPECEEISAPFAEAVAQASPPASSSRGKGANAGETPALPATVMPARETVGAAEKAVAVPAGKLSGPAFVAEEVAVEGHAEESPIVGVATQKKAVAVETGRTILRTLLQKCHGLGVSEHVAYAQEGCFAIVLAPSGLNREAATSGMLEMMAQMNGFCGGYGLGEPFKLVIHSTDGVVVGGEIVRGEPNRLVILGSLNRSAAGTMSLFLDRFEGGLHDLPSPTGAGLQFPRFNRELNMQFKRMPVWPGGLPEETCRKVVSVLSECGIQSYLSGCTGSGEKFMVAWGGTFSAKGISGGGTFDFRLFSQYCSQVGVGEFESSVVVTSRAKLTFHRAGAEPSSYLVCVFPANCAEGFAKAKADKAIKAIQL